MKDREKGSRVPGFKGSRVPVLVTIHEFTYQDETGWHTVPKGHGEVPASHPDVKRALEKGWLQKEGVKDSRVPGVQGRKDEESAKAAKKEEKPKSGSSAAAFQGKKKTGGK